MEEALITLLKASPAVTDVVATRINWALKPQGSALPAVTLTRISGARDMVMAGPSGLCNSRVQIDCLALSYTAAKRLARAVRDTLNGFKGLVGAVALQGVFLDAERDLPEMAASPDRLFRVSLDFIIWHGE